MTVMSLCWKGCLWQMCPGDCFSAWLSRLLAQLSMDATFIPHSLREGTEFLWLLVFPVPDHSHVKKQSTKTPDLNKHPIGKRNTAVPIIKKREEYRVQGTSLWKQNQNWGSWNSCCFCSTTLFCGGGKSIHGGSLMPTGCALGVHLGHWLVLR